MGDCSDEFSLGSVHGWGHQHVEEGACGSNSSCQVLWGVYLPGMIGKPSLVSLPNTARAGKNLVPGSGVFQYERMTLWKVSKSRSPEVT